MYIIDTVCSLSHLSKIKYLFSNMCFLTILLHFNHFFDCTASLKRCSTEMDGHNRICLNTQYVWGWRFRKFESNFKFRYRVAFRSWLAPSLITVNSYTFFRRGQRLPPAVPESKRTQVLPSGPADLSANATRMDEKKAQLHPTRAAAGCAACPSRRSPCSFGEDYYKQITRTLSVITI